MGGFQSRFESPWRHFVFVASAGVAVACVGTVVFRWKNGKLPNDVGFLQNCFYRVTNSKSGSTQVNILEEEINIYELGSNSEKDYEPLYFALNCLLNGGGGTLVLRNKGYRRFDAEAKMAKLDEFREKPNKKLQEMLYGESVNIADVFQSSNEQFRNDKGELLKYTVDRQGLKGLYAVHWNSYLKDDFAVQKVNFPVAYDFLKNVRNFLNETDQSRMSPDTLNMNFIFEQIWTLGEDNAVECKRYQPGKGKDTKNYCSLKKDLIDNIPKYVSAFTKRPNGGHFLGGIDQEKGKADFIVKGIKLKDGEKEDLMTHIKSTITKDMCWLSAEGRKLLWNEIDPYFKVKFHNIEDKEDLYVIEISVARFYGVVFTRRSGPVIGSMKNGRPIDVTIDQLYKILVSQGFEFDIIIVHGRSGEELARNCKRLAIEAIGEQSQERVKTESEVAVPGQRRLNMSGYFKKAKYVLFIVEDKEGMAQFRNDIALLKGIGDCEGRAIPVVHSGLQEEHEEISPMHSLDLDNREYFVNGVRNLFRDA